MDVTLGHDGVTLKGQKSTNLLLNGVDLARQAVADRLVDDAKDDRIQRAAGEQELMQALTYLYCTYTLTCTQ